MAEVERAASGEVGRLEPLQVGSARLSCSDMLLIAATRSTSVSYLLLMPNVFTGSARAPPAPAVASDGGSVAMAALRAPSSMKGASCEVGCSINARYAGGSTELEAMGSTASSCSKDLKGDDSSKGARRQSSARRRPSAPFRRPAS